MKNNNKLSIFDTMYISKNGCKNYLCFLQMSVRRLRRPTYQEGSVKEAQTKMFQKRVNQLPFNTRVTCSIWRKLAIHAKCTSIASRSQIRSANRLPTVWPQFCVTTRLTQLELHSEQLMDQSTKPMHPAQAYHLQLRRWETIEYKG